LPALGRQGGLRIEGGEEASRRAEMVESGAAQVRLRLTNTLFAVIVRRAVSSAELRRPGE